MRPYIALIVCLALYFSAIKSVSHVYGHATPHLRQDHHHQEEELNRNYVTDARLLQSPLTNDEEQIDEGILWSADLFQGDLVMSKTQVSYFFGQEAANLIEAAGLLDKSNEIINNQTQTANPTSTINQDEQPGRMLGIITNYNYLWKTRDANNIVVVPYEIQSTMTTAEQTTIQNAMSHITTKTGVVKFVARTTEPDWIYFQNTASGCWSYVGRIGGKQSVNVVSACGFGATVHEIYHALGFQHEQSRSDRDDYVTINWANIQSGKEGNFYKETTNSLGSPYDYKSIMHYGTTAFGIGKSVCTPTAVKTDTVTRIKFQKSTVDSNTAYCFNVVNGNVALSEGQTVNFRPCGENNYANQDWIAESFGTGFNVIRFALDPTYCLSVNYVNSVEDGAPLVLKKCVQDTFDNQHFMFEQYSWTDVSFRWGNDTGFTITRDKTVGVASTYSMFLKAYGFDSYADQDFTVEFVAKTTGRSATVNSFCSIQTQATIDAKGNSVGQRSGLSVEDIRQLQYLYQCPSGPRNVNSFCSTDCKCKWNQGACTSDDQCETGFRCLYDGVSLNRCLPIISPTATPTNDPTATPTKAPTSKSPTRNPTQKPSVTPTTKSPTKDPTRAPTATPTTKSPTKNPTKAPVTGPTKAPVPVPTKNPTLPTNSPTKNPTRDPTTGSPTTRTPTKNPTNPTNSPTTRSPSKNPTKAPTNTPTTSSPTTTKPTTVSPTNTAGLAGGTPSPTAGDAAASTMMIGIGVAVPIVAAIAAAGVFVVLRRRRSQQGGSSRDAGSAAGVSTLAVARQPVPVAVPVAYDAKYDDDDEAPPAPPPRTYPAGMAPPQSSQPAVAAVVGTAAGAAVMKSATAKQPAVNQTAPPPPKKETTQKVPNKPASSVVSTASTQNPPPPPPKNQKPGASAYASSTNTQTPPPPPPKPAALTASATKPVTPSKPTNRGGKS